MSNDKNNKTNDKNQTFYGGLSLKEFRQIGKVGIHLNDISWAGRLYHVAPYWFKKLSTYITVCFALTVLSLLIIWVSIAMRPPALLLGVYPQGEIVCFPKLISINGNVVARDKAYDDVCSSLDRKAGKRWEVNAFNQEPSQDAISGGEQKENFVDPNSTSPSTQNPQQSQTNTAQQQSVNN